MNTNEALGRPDQGTVAARDLFQSSEKESEGIPFGIRFVQRGQKSFRVPERFEVGRCRNAFERGGSRQQPLNDRRLGPDHAA